ncbi:MAG: helix-turn-helix transcriptional regulator [Microcoleus sp. PH2017_29_MFU_D_A]|uniref:helix-turn-helix domain-containing protein n=1 Tax=unclassified Microcoleus TaxID=2642155 RepID=UPI001D90F8A1|nr:MULTISPECIES: AraC family transcriptional regulator [unclassified Microcoleus]MCC3606044.1 helix-turn-helix transcriptional regulator [Microcoleus sp. PH2017_29_MFU_D_A]MCC3634932.1 helix-turn-helix transcriptional regulator [Microcoleus sp. PH2017_37_MFU_D_B]TAE57714.1 MAG: AraC family transcriptional regulator [Oscillatoriales cyanobacterium]
MRTSEAEVKLIDFSQEKATDFLLPQPAVLTSSGWDKIYYEHHQQPQFDTPEHQGTWHVIAHCPAFDVSGERSGERWLDGKLKTEARNQGDIAVIPAGISQRCNWNRLSEFTILAIAPTLLEQVGQDLVNCDRIELIPHYMEEQDILIQGIFGALRQELEFGQIGGYLLIDSLKTALAIHLLRNYCTTQPRLSSYTDGLSKPKLQQVREYINEHLHQEIKLIELAAIAQISPYHFLRLFKQSTGLTPHQYILQRRIDKAKYLLQESKLSIAEIAFRVGFCDQSHLTRCFKRLLGMTPKQFLSARSQ